MLRCVSILCGIAHCIRLNTEPESAQHEAGHNDAPPRLRTKSTGSRSSSPMSVLPSEPPTTDSDGFTVNRTAYDSDEALDRVPQAPKLGLQHRGSSKQSQLHAPSRRYAVMESSDNEDVEEAQIKVPTKTSCQVRQLPTSDRRT